MADPVPPLNWYKGDELIHLESSLVNAKRFYDNLIPVVKYYSDYASYTGFSSQGRERSYRSSLSQADYWLRVVRYYESRLQGIITPVPVFDSTVVTGELYRNGVLYQSGDFIQGDIDNLLSVGGYTFVQTDTPRTDVSIDTSPADPFAGGFDPDTLQGLPFTRNPDGSKTYLFPDGTELTVQPEIEITIDEKLGITDEIISSSDPVNDIIREMERQKQELGVTDFTPEQAQLQPQQQQSLTPLLLLGGALFLS